MKKRLLSLLLALMMVLSLIPLTAMAVETDETAAGHIVVSFEIYDDAEHSTMLLMNPTKVGYTAEDSGQTIAERLLGAENVNIDKGWMKSFTIDEIEYSPESMEMTYGSWLVYRNNSQDGVGPADYAPEDGDVYRFILTSYDPVTYAMPTLANDMNALYWSVAENGGDVTSAYALIQKDGGASQAEVDAMTATLATSGGSHYVLIDGRTIQVDSNYMSTVTLTADKTAAAAGETVTVTVNTPEGLEMVEGSLKASGTALTAGEGGAYTFVMPDHTVSVTADFRTADNGKLQTAEFFYDEYGTQPIDLVPAFDKDVTEYKVDVYDYLLEDDLYFKATFDESASAQWEYYMEYSGYGFYTDGPEVTSGEIDGHSQANMLYPGMTNGFKHRLNVVSSGGIETSYYFQTTMYPTLDTLEIGGEEVEGFEPDTAEYAVTLPAGTESLELTAVPYDEDVYYVYLNGGDEDIASEETEVELQAGQNVIEITVDDDAGTTFTYTLTVTVEEPAAPVELTITNNTGMFKAVSAYLETTDGKTELVMALSGTGYHYLYKGTYEQAVANGDNRDNWIKGYVNTDEKWEFRIPVEEGESYIPLVAISQSYLDKYDQGLNVLARAFYPRQVEIDAEAKTLVTGDYEFTQELAVTNNVKMFKVSSAALHTVGGPNSNNYKSDLVLTMGSDSFSKAYAGPADEAAAADETVAIGEGRVFEIPVRWVETFGSPETMQTLIGEPVIMSFYSVSKETWYERQFTISEVDGTLVIDEAPVPADSAVVYLTVSNAGVLALVREAVTVKDINRDGILTYDEALTAAHNEFCPGGYAAVESTYGLYVTKLWNVEYGGFLFYTNDVSIPMGVGTDTVADGDELVAAVLEDGTYYSDVFTYFTEKEARVKTGESLELTLKASSFNLDNVAGAGLTVGTWKDGVFNELEGKITDADGKVELTFDEMGTYVISADGTIEDIVTVDWETYATEKMDCPIVAPVCVVTVDNVPESFDYDGDDLKFITTDGATFGMFTPQPGTRVTLADDGESISVTLYPKNKTVYAGFYMNAAIDDPDTWQEDSYIAAEAVGSDPYGVYTFTLSKDFCGKAVAVAIVKPDGVTTVSKQYYLAIPSEDKLPWGVPAKDITVTLTVSNAGVLALVREPVTVKDLDCDGVMTYDEALIAAHDAFCPGGYATTVSSYGLYVTKLWNVEWAGYMFYTNDVSIPMGVGIDTVTDGDELVAAVLEDGTYYSDVYTYFTEKTAEAEPGKPVELTLKASSFNLDNVAGAGLTVGTWNDGVFTALEGVTTDADGKAELTFDEPGIYVVSADGTIEDDVTVDWTTYATEKRDCPIIAPVCIVKVEGTPAFKSQSLVLSGQIGVNFYMDLSQLTEETRSASYVEFTVGKGSPVEVAFDANKTNSKGYFGFTCYVKSIQMADTIKAVYHYGDGKTIQKEYSVLKYIQAVDRNASAYDAKTLALVHSIADYGHYAQIYLAEVNGWTVGDKYAEMTLFYTDSYDYADILSKVQANAFVKTIEGSNVTKATYKLHLDSETTVDVLLTTSDGEAPTNVKLVIHEVESGKDVTKTVTPEKQSDGRYLIRVSGISAHKLGDMMTISGTAGKAFEVQVCALSYVRSVLNSTSTSEAAKNGLSSLYAYYAATMAYRKK